MKKSSSKAIRERPMRREYDFRGGVRGKYAARFPQDAIAVVLDPDVATVFGDAESVNQALRALVKVARKTVASPPHADRVAERGSSPRMQRTGRARR